MLNDVRFALRQLCKNPGFTFVAVLTLALGIGANAALFSVVNAVLLNPLPYPRPEQLVSLHQSKPNFPTGSISYPNFRDWQKENRTFSGMAIGRSFSANLIGAGEAEQVDGRRVSANLFSVLGVKPMLGRDFAPGEDEPGVVPVVVISAGLWQRKFGTALDVLGKSLTLDDNRYTIYRCAPGEVHTISRHGRVCADGPVEQFWATESQCRLRPPRHCESQARRHPRPGTGRPGQIDAGTGRSLSRGKQR